MSRGMHHRPSAARRRAVQTAGGGFAVLAVMTAAQGTANAAEGPLPQRVLDEIIDCESDFRNIENPGPSTASGFYQIVDGTWRAFGGTEFAPRAIGATLEQQTIVAQRIYEGQGVGAWQTCGQAREAIRAWEREGSPQDPPPAAPTLAPAPENEPETQEEAQETLDQQAETPPAAEVPAAPPVEQVPAAGETEVSLEHIVVRDDTLSLVALAEGICTPEEDIKTCWEDFYQQNIDVVGGNPDLIFPGQVLTYRGLALRNAPVTVEPAGPLPPPEGGDPGVVEEEDAPAVAEPESPPEVVEEAAEEAPTNKGVAFPVPGGVAPGSTNFGASRDGGSRSHQGLDIDCAQGDDIVFVQDAVVTFSGQQGGYGNVVYAVSADGTETRYAHLNSRDVAKGEPVLAGDRVGSCGVTGNIIAGPNGDGSHLHFEVRLKGGAAIDPLPWLRSIGAI